MPTNYSDSFIALPQASGHLTAQQIELASINETAINEASIDAIGGGGGFSWGVGSVSGADDFGDAAFGGDFGAGAVSSTDAQKTALAQLRGQASALGQLRAT